MHVTRGQMNLLILLIIAAFGFAFFLYTEHENEEAIRNHQDSRCWGPECHRILTEGLLERSRLRNQ